MGFGRAPHAVSTASGVSSSSLTPGREFRRSSRGVGFLFRVRSRRCRPRSFSAPPHRSGPERFRARDPPLLGFFLPRTRLRRVPLVARSAAEPPFGWVRVARPPPVPSSGFLPLSTVLAAITDRANPSRSPSFSVAPRRFAALFHAACVPGAALQSFPLSRSRTRSRGPLLPCGFAFDRRQATRRELFRCFPRRADPLPRFARRLAGRMGWDDGSSRPLKENALPRAPLLQLVGLAGKRPARPLRSFAPLGSPFSRRSPPWPG